MLEDVLSANTDLVNTSKSGDYIPRPDFRPLTKFEARVLQTWTWCLGFIFCEEISGF